MRTLFVLFAGLLLSAVAAAQKTVSFTTDDKGIIFADVDAGDPSIP